MCVNNDFVLYNLNAATQTFRYSVAKPFTKQQLAYNSNYSKRKIKV